MGDHTRGLIDGMSGARGETMDGNDPVTFAKRAVRAGSMDADAIHVQHEYGLFGTMTMVPWMFFSAVYRLAAWQRTPVVITNLLGGSRD